MQKVASHRSGKWPNFHASSPQYRTSLNGSELFFSESFPICFTSAPVISLFGYPKRSSGQSPLPAGAIPLYPAKANGIPFLFRASAKGKTTRYSTGCSDFWVNTHVVFHNANIKEKKEEYLYFFADSLQNFTNSAFSGKPASAAASPEHRCSTTPSVSARIPPQKQSVL